MKTKPLWLVPFSNLNMLCQGFKQVLEVKVKWKREKEGEHGKKKLIFKMSLQSMQCISRQKASHYCIAFVESSSGQIVTGLFLYRGQERQAEQRTPNYQGLWGIMKVLISLVTEQAVLVFECMCALVWMVIYVRADVFLCIIRVWSHILTFTVRCSSYISLWVVQPVSLMLQQ